MSTWIITGAATGLGRLLTEHVLAEGHQVVAAGLDVVPLADLTARHPSTLVPVIADVTRAADRRTAVTTAKARFGGIDVLVNNAGIDFIGAIEEQEEADYRAVFEVNFFAAVAMVRDVLPTLREQRSGLIINVSSMDGIASLPANAFYSASKFAIESITDALAVEVEHLGIRTLLVEPGSIRTGIIGRTKVSGQRIDDYEPVIGPFLDAVAMPDAPTLLFPGDAAASAAAIYEEAVVAKPRRRLILGSDALANIERAVAALGEDLAANRASAGSIDFASSAS
ncbi:SDR family NAD(P)-dependent oxidoreductase [Nocardioides sp. CER19]|uniref:SDR family NAD(P)-dependent oxidoreductase n=1 Tax=Nocardioides sp. CER19 TaxID=3038538 RepID=UPI0024472BB8|nr:SDR family NAD(P)-dependent oxidoreductase [Nocardioides sp. CER19]MDH2414384.1 SDR family NAD(P)-dependent oxidoreductase [Nocardioides sp. CER19]